MRPSRGSIGRPLLIVARFSTWRDYMPHAGFPFPMRPGKSPAGSPADHAPRSPYLSMFLFMRPKFQAAVPVPLPY